MLCTKLLKRDLVRCFGRRTLFTDDFLGVSVFKEKRDRARQEMKSAGVTKSQLLDQLKNVLQKESGDQEARVVLSKDVRKVIYASQTDQEIKEAGSLIKEYVFRCHPWNNPALMQKKAFILKDYMNLCYAHLQTDSATHLWNDQEFMRKVGFIEDGSGDLAANMPSTTLCYLDLLYKRKLFNQMLEDILKIEAQVKRLPPNCYMMYMMGCLQLDTSEALNRATELYERLPYLATYGKMANPYALLVLNHGKNSALAYEVVSAVHKQSVLRTGVLVYILARLNRPDEACRLLKSTVNELEAEDSPLSHKSLNDQKLVFSFDTVTALTQCVESKKDTALNRRLATIFNKLDNVAVIAEKSIKEVVCSDIDATKDMKYRRMKSKARFQRKKTIVFEDDGEFEDEQHVTDTKLDDEHHRSTT